MELHRSAWSDHQIKEEQDQRDHEETAVDTCEALPSYEKAAEGAPPGEGTLYDPAGSVFRRAVLERAPPPGTVGLARAPVHFTGRSTTRRRAHHSGRHAVRSWMNPFEF